MAHYVKVLDGIVVDLIVAEEDFFDTFEDTSPGTWIQTSYNTRGGAYYTPDTDQLDSDQSKALRKNYAGIDYTYSTSLDAFIPPKPHPSWVLNETTCLWEAPVALPDDDQYYKWDETNTQWIVVE